MKFQPVRNRLYSKTGLGEYSFRDEFDPQFYLAQIKDEHNISDLLYHYLTDGWKKFLDPNPRFSTEKYLMDYPDVKNDGINPFHHYLTFGIYEGRFAKPSAFELSNAERLFGSNDKFVALITSELQLLGIPGGIGAAVEGLAKLIVEIDKKPIIFLRDDGRVSEESLKRAQGVLNSQGIALEHISTRKYCTNIDAGSDSYAMYKALSRFESSLETIIFPEYLGLAYHTILAKRVGLRFLGTNLVANLHGSKRWATFTQGRFIGDHSGLWSDYLERESVQHADLVVTPSNFLLQWYVKNEWINLPNRMVTIQNLTSVQMKELSTEDENQLPKTEKARDLVFIGKNTYKGFEYFLRSMSIIDESSSLNKIKLTIYGVSADIEGLKALRMLEKYADKWSFDFRIAAPKNRYELLDQLKSMTNPIVVVASEIENSPYAVLDSLSYGYCTISSQEGGGSELYNDRNSSSFLFDPKDPTSLSEKIIFAIKNPSIRPHLNISNLEGKNMWAQLISDRNDIESSNKFRIQGLPKVTVGITHFQREHFVIDAIRSVQNQTYAGEIKIIVVDDGSKETKSKRSLRQILTRLDIELLSRTIGISEQLETQ